MTKSMKPKKKEKVTRISFDEHDAGHLYEMAMEHMCLQWEDCALCELLRKRLDKFLGKNHVAEIKKILRKNGYCNKLKVAHPIRGEK